MVDENSLNIYPCLSPCPINIEPISYEVVAPYIKNKKWECQHGPHNPKYFNNVTNDGIVSKLVDTDNQQPIRNLPQIRQFKKEPWRDFTIDHGGIRKMDWHPSKYYNYNPKPKLKLSSPPYVKPNPYSLLIYYQKLLDWNYAHPGDLLERFLYREIRLPPINEENCLKDDEVNDCNRNLFKTDMSPLDIWRLRFLSRNYQSFDSWNSKFSPEKL